MMISLKCEDCLGTMEVDENREVLTCPYCGSKKMIPVSDAVKITKLNNEHDLEVRKQKSINNDKLDRNVMIYFIFLLIMFLLYILVFKR